MSKKILGLDLGTTSIGWAYVHETQDKSETSKIINAGVRVLPLTTDERTDFEKGKATSINASRTLARGARRNLNRYQLRRNNLLEILKDKGFIVPDFKYAETEKDSTFSSYKLRARASYEKISLEELAKVLLMINKKRGYKSSRKAKSAEEGQAINGMEVAKRLYDEKITPGQLVHQLLLEGKRYMPEFYRSDLKHEFDLIWDFQKTFHSNVLNEDLKLELDGKGINATKAIFYSKFKTNPKEIKGSRDEVKRVQFQLRSDAIKKELSLEEVIYVISDINNNLNSSSGYLGAISDRSKELYFNNLTIGEYLYQQLERNRHTSLKNQVFYRQDYMDEFEVIWETQAKFHQELNKELKTEIRDVVIFYQRKLKSQKHLISNCEFELHHKACPKSSPIFQEFKIWNVLNNLIVIDSNNNEKIELDIETKQLLFTELNIYGRLNSKEILQKLGYSDKTHELNFKEI
jgi:CRISPR-associated endonuclease Csn1